MIKKVLSDYFILAVPKDLAPFPVYLLYPLIRACYDEYNPGNIEVLLGPVPLFP